MNIYLVMEEGYDDYDSCTNDSIHGAFLEKSNAVNYIKALVFENEYTKLQIHANKLRQNAINKGYKTVDKWTLPDFNDWWDLSLANWRKWSGNDSENWFGEYYIQEVELLDSYILKDW